MTSTRLAATCACVAGLVYLTGLEWDVFWGDSAQFAERVSALHLSAHARGYPLMHLTSWALGRLIGSPALAVNLFSLVTSAIAVGLAAFVVRDLGGSRLAAITAAGVLGFAHTFWSYATVAEVYGLHDAFLLAALAGATRLRSGRRHGATILGLALGLSLLHHRMMLFSAPVLLVWAVAGVPANERRSQLLRTVRWGVAGAVPFAALCVANALPALAAPDAGQALWKLAKEIAYGGDMQMDFVVGARGKTTLGSAAYLAKWIVFNVPGPGLLLAGLGIAGKAARQSGLSTVLVALLLVNCVFPFRYDWTGDQYAFLSPLYPLLAVSAGLGLDVLARSRLHVRPWVACSAAVLSPPILYATLALSPLGQMLVHGLTPRATRAMLLPAGRREPAAGTWCRRQLTSLPRGATLYAEWGDGAVYKYLQSVENLRGDVRVSIGYPLALPVQGTPTSWVSILPIWPRPLDRLPAPIRAAASRSGEEELLRLDAGR